MKRFLLIFVLFVAVGCGGEKSGRAKDPEISREAAINAAYQVMGVKRTKKSDRFLAVETIWQRNQSNWVISHRYRYGDGWQVIVDGQTGKILKTHKVEME